VALSCSTASQPCAAYRGRARIERLVGKLKRFKRVARTAGLTAWRALVVEGGLKAGDVVLVLGTGDVSIFALQLAKMMGATVIATSSSDEKLERVRAMGADLTINYRQHEDWGTRARDWTGGRGVDHVIEVGGPGTLTQSITAARIGGHISLIGVLTGVAGEVPTAALMAKQARLQGLIVGNRRHQMDLMRAIDATGLQPLVDRSFAPMLSGTKSREPISAKSA
jgi:NADPH:quinone reductase-like Zn-dependent oxidoreductase